MSRIREAIFGSILGDLVRRSGNVDVLVVQGDRTDRVATPLVPQTAATTPVSILQAVGSVLVATGVCFLTFPTLALTNLVMIYLLSIAWVAYRHGFKESFLAALLSVLAVNFFFVPPRWTFAVADFEYVVTFAVMLIVSLLISTLAARSKAQSERALDRERRTTMLLRQIRFHQ